MVGDWRRCASLGANCVRLDVLAVGVAAPGEPLNDLPKHVKEQLSVRVNEEDFLPRIAAAGDVIHSPRAFDPQWASHDGSLASSVREYKT